MKLNCKHCNRPLKDAAGKGLEFCNMMCKTLYDAPSTPANNTKEE